MFRSDTVILMTVSTLPCKIREVPYNLKGGGWYRQSRRRKTFLRA